MYALYIFLIVPWAQVKPVEYIGLYDNLSDCTNVATYANQVLTENKYEDKIANCVLVSNNKHLYKNNIKLPE